MCTLNEKLNNTVWVIVVQFYMYIFFYCLLGTNLFQWKQHVCLHNHMVLCPLTHNMLCWWLFLVEFLLCIVHCNVVVIVVVVKIGFNDGWKWRHFILNYSYRNLIVNHFTRSESLHPHNCYLIALSQLWSALLHIFIYFLFTLSRLLLLWQKYRKFVMNFSFLQYKNQLLMAVSNAATLKTRENEIIFFFVCVIVV